MLFCLFLLCLITVFTGRSPVMHYEELMLTTDPLETALSNATRFVIVHAGHLITASEIVTDRSCFMSYKCENCNETVAFSVRSTSHDNQSR